MRLLKVDPGNPDPEAIREAAEAIRRGKLVVFPTETVYGLAADALDEFAVRRVFEAKGRLCSLPLPIQIAGAEALGQVASSVPEAGRALAARFWPGPLTLVVPKNASISALVSAGTNTIGVRVPDHPVALALLREVGSPVIATSANVSGSEPAKTVEEAVRALGEAASVVLDAGPSPIGVESTVVDVTVNPPCVVRRATITLAQIIEVVGEVVESG